MKRSLVISSIFILLAGSAFAQKTKPWTEWTRKDAERILNDSAWGQTLTTGESEGPSQTSAITPAVNAGAGMSNKGESGEKKASGAVYFRVRFMTARPIREAFARTVLLQQTSPNKDLETQLQGFIDRDFGKYLVVILAVESPDEKKAAGMTMGLSRITAEAIKEKVYLERKDGKRIMVTDYKPPTNDGMGAKLIFERMVDGQPFLTEASDSVRFFMEFGKQKVDVKFKTANMLYGGKLEY